jgi:hypothetical protein
VPKLPQSSKIRVFDVIDATMAEKKQRKLRKKRKQAAAASTDKKPQAADMNTRPLKRASKEGGGAGPKKTRLLKHMGKSSRVVPKTALTSASGGASGAPLQVSKLNRKLLTEDQRRRKLHEHQRRRAAVDKKRQELAEKEARKRANLQQRHALKNKALTKQKHMSTIDRQKLYSQEQTKRRLKMAQALASAAASKNSAAPRFGQHKQQQQQPRMKTAAVSASVVKSSKLLMSPPANRVPPPKISVYVVPKPEVTAIVHADRNNYEMTDHEYDSDWSDSANKKRIPGWARKEQLAIALRGNEGKDPDSIFPSMEAQSCNLAELFQGYRTKSRFQKRSSSGNWYLDRLHWQEQLAYKKHMGYIP